MIVCLMFLLFISLSQSDLEPDRVLEEIKEVLNQTRRILKGKNVGSTRSYMVYLRHATVDPPPTDPNWLCGGVIIHPRYILTSAACIHDVTHFYVIAGTHKWIPLSDKNNKCIINGAKRAIGKSVPKSYLYDGDEFNNIRWMAHDIAVVKVDDPFNFKRRVKGCNFIPMPIAFNNRSESLENPKTEASITGWGTTEKFSDIEIGNTINSPILLETRVELISKQNCKKRWPERYHSIIDEHMLCSKDGSNTDMMNSLCDENDKNCKDVAYSYEEVSKKSGRRVFEDSDSLMVHTAAHVNGRRRSRFVPGGFCENDHGGPLVYGWGKHAVVVGIISACLVKDVTQKCHGPFLYTSVWKNRHLINCVIQEEAGEACKEFLRSRKTLIEETNFDWSHHHPDGSTKPEDSEEIETTNALPTTASEEEETTEGTTLTTVTSAKDIFAEFLKSRS